MATDVNLGGKVFVINVKDLSGSKTRTLITEPKHILRRAKKSEIKRLLYALRLMMPKTVYPTETIYEYEINRIENPEDTSTLPFTENKLPEDKFKYFIIEYKDGYNDPMKNLSNVFFLLDKEILLGPQFYGKRITDFPERIHFLEKFNPYPSNNFFQSITKDDAFLIRETYEKFIKHDNDIFDIQSRINQLKDLYRIPSNSSLRILGYFSILESILTRSPDKNDNFNSINKQIRNKFYLLNNRFKEKVILKDFFNESYNPPGDIHKDRNKKFWTKLYDLRSTIAHGGKVDYESRFSLFRNQRKVIQFLHKVIKKILYHSLFEPELFRDLK